jgi:RNA polymerase sigma-70 factor (family 1)
MGNWPNQAIPSACWTFSELCPTGQDSGFPDIYLFYLQKIIFTITSLPENWDYIMLRQTMQIRATDEKVLLDQLVQGDAPAFTALYEKYSLKLYANILRLVKSEDTAKEILQDLFLKIWELRTQIDPERSFRSFLYKIAGNLVYDHFRKVSRDKRLSDSLLYMLEEQYSHLEESVIYNESLELINAAISQLPEMRRRVYVLGKIEGQTYEEISSQLGISHSTISDHIVKANRFIKAYLTSRTDLALSLMITLIGADLP